jgi:SAM-dependent methyltransferase
MAPIGEATHPHYAHYDSEQISRLDGFFGRVDSAFNDQIVASVIGPRVLDFGCGFGSLVDRLRSKGFDSVGIDLLESQVSAGRSRFPAADLRLSQAGPLPFEDDAFDTVVFKESLHHLAAEGDLETDLREVARVCSKRIVVLEPNPSIPLKVGRTLIGHVDPTLPPRKARAALDAAGFDVNSERYLASIAFPLSGGYVGRPLVSPRFPQFIFHLDNAIVRLLGRSIAWRYLMTGDKRT